MVVLLERLEFLRALGRLAELVHEPRKQAPLVVRDGRVGSVERIDKLVREKSNEADVSGDKGQRDIGIEVDTEREETDSESGYHSTLVVESRV